MPPRFISQNIIIPKIDKAVLGIEESLKQKIVQENFLNEMYERNDRVEIQKYYQSVLGEAAPFFDRYAGKKRPQFNLVTDPNIKTAAFYVDENNIPRVQGNLDFFIKRKINKPQLIFFASHELRHFMDREKDKRFNDSLIEKSEILALEMSKRLLEERPGTNFTSEQKKRLKDYLQKIYYSGYYNTFLDIFVNNDVASQPEFSKDLKTYPSSYAPDVERLYRETMFSDRDFSTQPEFYQYLYFLLRGENVPEGMRVTHGAQVALSQDYEINFKKYDKRRGFSVPVKKTLNTQEIINTFLNPNSDEQFEGDEKEMRISNKKDTSLKYRSKYIDDTLLPTFSELLFNDLKNKLDDLEKQKEEESEENEQGEQGEQGEQSDSEKSGNKKGKGEPSGEPADGLGDFLDDILDKMEEGSPDFIPDEVLDEYAEWKEGDDAKEEAEKIEKEKQNQKAKEKKDKKEAEEKKQREQAGQEIDKANQEKQMEDIIKNFAKENGISEDIAQRVADARRDVAPHIDKLSELWRRITMGQGSDTAINVEGEYKTGSEVNVEAFIRQFDRVINGEFEKLRIMKRAEHTEKPSDKPERIEVSLVIDQSGSMAGQNSSKNKILERVTTMLQVSLDKFNQLLILNKEQSKSKLHVDTEVIAFGNSAKQVAGFRYREAGIEGAESDQNSSRKGVQNFNTFESIGVDMGGTYDNMALDMVIENMTREVKEKIEAGKIMKIVFEITDGGSTNGAATKERIEKLASEGVLVFGFQIGEVDEDDQETFENTWNKNTDGVKRGYVVGEDFAKLPEMIAKMLEEFLKDVEIYE